MNIKIYVDEIIEGQKEIIIELLDDVGVIDREWITKEMLEEVLND